MPRRKRVALIIETSNEYARGLLHGIRAYIREHQTWEIDLDERRRGEATDWLKDFKGDGVIARIENAAIAKEVLDAGLPCVDVSAARQVPGIPYVETDDAEIARLAFEHLTGRGLRHLGYCGDPRFNWSDWRRDQFVRLARQAGIECRVYPEEAAEVKAGRARGGRGSVDGKAAAAVDAVPRSAVRSSAHFDDLDALARWVAALPKPAGVMACYDIRGRQVLAACRAAELAVPDDVAVIGVDNDELLCDLSDPPLSSVAPDTDATGYEAARLLDRMMAGERIPPAAHLLKPIGVVARLSTDTLAVSDPEMGRAVRYLRAHACDGINVADVLRQVTISRRAFETEFKRLFGRMPHEEIVRTKIDRVKELLTQTDLPLYAVAERCGFKHVEYMSVVFKKKVGLPPSEYRDRKGR